MLGEVNIGKRNRLLMDIANGRTLTRNWVHDADTIFYLSDENFNASLSGNIDDIVSELEDLGYITGTMTEETTYHETERYDITPRGRLYLMLPPKDAERIDQEWLSHRLIVTNMYNDFNKRLADEEQDFRSRVDGIFGQANIERRREAADRAADDESSGGGSDGGEGMSDATN